MVSIMKIVDTKKRTSRAEFVNGVRVNHTGRRTYTADYKLAVVRRCQDPGASVAAIALAHRINANLVRRWIVRHQRMSSPKPKLPATLLPVTIEATSASVPDGTNEPGDAPTKHREGRLPTIEIEVYGARIHLRGDVDAQALRRVLDVLAQR